MLAKLADGWSSSLRSPKQALRFLEKTEPRRPKSSYGGSAGATQIVPSGPSWRDPRRGVLDAQQDSKEPKEERVEDEEATEDGDRLIGGPMQSIAHRPNYV